MAELFDNWLLRQGEELESLRSDIAGGVGSSAIWESLSKVYDDFTGVYAEPLAFLQGLLARWAGLDNGLLRIANEPGSDLARHAVARGEDTRPLTVLAEGEFVGEPALLIRIRFPQVGVWELPVAAHEVGHLVLDALLRNTRQVQELLAAHRRAGWSAMWHAQEFCLTLDIMRQPLSLTKLSNLVSIRVRAYGTVQN